MTASPHILAFALPLPFTPLSSSLLLLPRILIFTSFFFFPCILSLPALVWEKFQKTFGLKKKDIANSLPIRSAPERFQRKTLLAFGRQPKLRYSPFDLLFSSHRSLSSCRPSCLGLFIASSTVTVRRSGTCLFGCDSHLVVFFSASRVLVPQ